jgi:hypothetical protein
VPDDSMLTQHASKAGQFRNAPRIDREVGVSVLIGEWSVEDATRYVLTGNSPTRQQLSRAVVRLTRAGTLREARFAVVHTPGRIKDGPHATVVWPDGDPLSGPQASWPAEVSAQFDSCFNVAREVGQNEP